MNKLRLIAVASLMMLASCGKYNPSAKYVVVVKRMGNYTILVKEQGLESQNVFRDQTFWICVSKEKFNSIAEGDEWCEKPADVVKN